MRRSLALGAFAAGVLLFAPIANAQTYQLGQYLGNMSDLNRFTYNTMGSAAQHANYTGGGANWTTLAGQNAARMAGTATATIGGRTVPLTLVSRVPLPAIVNAARGVAMLTPASAAVTILGFAAMNGWLTPAGLRWNNDPATNITHPFRGWQEGCTSGGCLQFASGTLPTGSEVWTTSRESACSTGIAYLNGLGGASYRMVAINAAGNCDMERRPAGSENWSYAGWMTIKSRLASSTESVPKTWDEAAPQLADPARDYGAVDWKGITEQLLQRGGSIPRGEISSTASGPASQPGERTVQTGKDAQGNPTTTTTQVTHNYTYNTNNVTHNTTTTTTVTDANGETIDETTETTDNEPEQAATDTPLPDVPDFYEQRYEDGLAGVWAQHKASFETTSLGTFALKLMPSGLGAGSCPQWSINLDVGIFDGGIHDLSISCSTWDACRVLLIIGALLLARRLVFGG